MSDHLLRLAKLVSRVTLEASGVETETHILGLNLIGDLEAAPPSERRTITREDYNNVVRGLSSHGLNDPERYAYTIAAAWRLTVED